MTGTIDSAPETPPVRTAVLPVAGRGTRLGRLTQAVPKELLPLGSRPTLDLVLDELVEAGVERAVLVTRPDKTVLNDYVTTVLGPDVRTRGLAVELCDQVAGPGNGGAVLSAAERLDGESAIVLWGDEVVFGSNRTDAVLRQHRRTGRPTIAVVRTTRDVLRRCGVARVGTDDRVLELVEKPVDPPADGLASIGGVVVDDEVLAALRGVAPAADGELYLSAALAEVVAIGRVDAAEVSGSWYETGSIAGYLTAFAAAADDEKVLKM